MAASHLHLKPNMRKTEKNKRKKKFLTSYKLLMMNRLLIFLQTIAEVNKSYNNSVNKCCDFHVCQHSLQKSNMLKVLNFSQEYYLMIYTVWVSVQLTVTDCTVLDLPQVSRHVPPQHCEDGPP